MYQVKFTTTYKKSYKLMKKRGLDLSFLDEVVDLLRQGKQLDEKYRDHGLSGNFAGFQKCHIKPDRLFCFLLNRLIRETFRQLIRYRINPGSVNKLNATGKRYRVHSMVNTTIRYYFLNRSCNSIHCTKLVYGHRIALT